MKNQILILFVLLIGINACKKSSDPEPDFSTILTSHPWTFNGFTAIIDGKTYTGKNSTINSVTYSTGSDPNTVFTYKADGTYTITGNDAEQGKWTLSGTQLTTIDDSGTTLVYTLSNASTSAVTLSLPEINFTDRTSLAYAELIAAESVVQSNGIDSSTLTPKKIQVQLNLKAK